MFASLFFVLFFFLNPFTLLSKVREGLCHQLHHQKQSPEETAAEPSGFQVRKLGVTCQSADIIGRLLKTQLWKLVLSKQVRSSS